MADVNEIQGSDILLEFSSDNGTTWKVLVCEQDGTFDSSLDISEEKTKCGSVIGVSDPSWSISGTAVANSKPSSTQVSYEQVQIWHQAKTKVDARMQSPANSALSLAVGDSIYHAGEGIFTSVSLNVSNGAITKFDWTFTGMGELINQKPA